MDKADSLMKQGVADGIFPGGVLLVARAGNIHFFEAYGQANILSGRKMTIDTVFDLASFTKPLSTTLAVIKLVQDKKLFLNQSIADILPGLTGSDKAPIRIDHLLAHVSGLPDYRPYFKELIRYPLSDRKHRLQTLLLNEPLIYQPGEKTVYSDLGFMQLALLIEKIAGCRLDAFVTRKIYAPDGIKDLFFIDTHQSTPDRDFAATEYCAWRNQMVEGFVHDENAYALGGISGHAGLFGTAKAVYDLLFLLLKGFHGNAGIFPPRLLSRFLNRYPGYERALGFDMPSAEDSSAGAYFNRDATVGHLGFTGTSFWMALDRSIIIVLLTNRIHTTRKNEAIKQFRPALHNAVLANI